MFGSNTNTKEYESILQVRAFLKNKFSRDKKISSKVYRNLQLSRI